MNSRCRLFLLIPLALAAMAGAQWQATISPARKAILDGIAPESLKGHLSFLASDLLEGRATPSRGLDIAAEYIAAQFRRAGLEPVGDDGYFQTATLAPRGGGEAAKVRNVVGVLRGSDPKLKDTYILLTAHYDHIGVRPSGEGDRTYNGANDDGSGTVAVIEIAAAMAKMSPRPKRSILFMCFFGEERGLLGSRHYGRNPIFPLKQTVAHINLEQIGRTDDDEGPRVSAATLTGFDYSDMGTIFEAAGKAGGVPVSKHPRFSDAYFSRSDNQAMADLGIPAHTVSTAYSYPDYHGVGDHWDKIDYPNMAKVARMVALGLLTLADSEREPRWSESNPRAKKYLDAWKALKGGV